VSSVEWVEAQEFCARLSRATGKRYRLPSEAEWEYACRGGTTTQFHLGSTITTDLVNFAGGYTYGSAQKGVSRERPTRVGAFGFANKFGLFDMHGNVNEWCLDVWHENYNGAPMDGRNWITPGGSPWYGCEEGFRVMRGGSFNQSPLFARSAHRDRRWWRNNKDESTGFRIVCEDN
jgi:formylglycine-generating enzyme required for sulfatase activity